MATVSFAVIGCSICCAARPAAIIIIAASVLLVVDVAGLDMFLGMPVQCPALCLLLASSQRHIALAQTHHVYPKTGSYSLYCKSCNGI